MMLLFTNPAFRVHWSDKDQNKRSKIRWNDETKIEPLNGLNKLDTILIACMEETNDGSITLSGSFSVTGTMKPVSIEGEMDAEKHLEILHENVFQCAHNLNVKFTVMSWTKLLYDKSQTNQKQKK